MKKTGNKLTRKERKEKQKAFKKRTGESKKGRISREVKYTLKQLETLYWNNEKLSMREKITEIIRAISEAYPNSDDPMVVHALVKWNDKIQRLGE